MRAPYTPGVSAVFLAAATVVAALTGITWKVALDVAQANERVVHTHQILDLLTHTVVNTVQIELSTQSYRISGDVARLTERNAAIDDRERQMAQLRTLTADNPGQQERWQRLRAVVDQRLAISRRVEALRRDQGAVAATAYASTAPLQETRDRIHGLLRDMENEERRLLQERNQTQLESGRQLALLGTLASGAFVALMSASYLLLRRRSQEAEAAHRALQHSEESLTITLHSIGDGVIATDAEGRVTRMNSVAERLTGWTLEQARGQPFADVFRIVHERTRETQPDPVAQVLASGQSLELANHTLLLARDGQSRPVADSAAPILDEQGRVRGVVMVFRDDSSARQARQSIEEQNARLELRVQERTAELRESALHLQRVINSVPALIAYVDRHQRYVYVNQQYRQCFAPEHADITGHTVREILGEERYRIAAPLIAQVLKGHPQSYDWEPFPGVWQVVNYLPKLDEDGSLSGYFVLGTDITERRQAEQALRDSQQQLARVLEGTDQGYWEWNLQTNAFTVSPRWETMLGYAPGEMQINPDNWVHLVHPEDYPLALASIARHLRGDTPSHAIEIRCKTRDGQWRWVLTRGRVVTHTEDGAPLLMSGTHTDVTERKQLEFAQREAGVVFDSSYEAIMVADADGLITKVNPAFTRITGYAQEEVQGQSPRLLSSGRHDAAFYREFWAALKATGLWRGEIWNRRKNGEVFAALQSITAVHDSQGQLRHYVSVFVDISQLKAHEAELDRVANFDSLTQLPNRRLLSDRLNQAILRADRNGKSAAVCFLDLDGFKDINDRLGHAVGDQLLVGVSNHLKTVLRAEDTLARLGGDEFVLLLSDVGSAQECALILDRVLDTLRRPVRIPGHVLEVSASIGVTLYPADAVDPDTLLRHADQAMYLAKQAGKNRYQLFDPENDRAAQHHRERLEALQQALERHEFVLHYQPKVDLDDGRVTGAEGLIRWQHPQRGLLPPGEFLPHLDGSPLEPLFGAWVIDTALAQMATWEQQGLRLDLSVNVSANHLLQAEFVGHLGQALARHPSIDPGRLEIEVLETAAIEDMALAVEVLHRCRTLGVRFALDDFGTGYSSLTYLRKLPVDTLKIDQSFVRDMLDNADDFGIVQGVIQMARVFSREVIAEGVETLAHGAALRRLGCPVVQGYGIARPMPAAQLPDWCQHWHAERAWEQLTGD